MERSSKLLSVIHFLTILIFLVFSTAAAQVSAAESTSGAGTVRQDQEKLDKLRKAAPKKIDALDDKLAEALLLYYDGRYGKALPIFNEIAAQVETMDLMWWIGTSAMYTGDLKLAVKKFQQMLTLDPKLSRVRLELAAAYFQLGKYKEAQKELEIVSATKPPPEVQANIDKLLAAINEASRRLHWSVRAALGVQWDDNVSAGPDNRLVNTGGGGTITLAQSAAKLGDTGYVTNLGGNVIYSFGERQLGPAWNTDLSYYSILYSKHSQFNYAMLDTSTGPWWVGRSFIVKVPVGYTIQYFGDAALSSMTTAQRDNQNQGYLTPGQWAKTNFSLAQDNSLTRLSYIGHIDPSIEYFFGKYFSLRGTFGYSRETYAPKWSQDSLSWNDQNQFDNQTRRWEISPNIFLFNRQHILSFTGGYAVSDADARINSYDDHYYTISYFMRFPTKTEVFLRFQRNYKDYKDKAPLFSDWRYDQKNIYTAVVSQNFLGHYFASFAFNYIQNDSNTGIYAFDKRTYTFSIGAYF
jgi:tetratricopeptide (TPR) repeat protein